MFVLTATLQELFDLAVRRLAAQKFQRSMDGDRCAYRGVNGRKCALGHLLSDEEMAQLYAEGNAVNTASAVELRVKATGEHLFGDAARYAFIADLQYAHDRDLDILDETMPVQLRRVAERHDLNTAVLDEVTKEVKL